MEKLKWYIKILSATCFYANTSEHGDVVDTKTDTPDKTGMPEKIVVDDISFIIQEFYRRNYN